ncbi:MAG: NAD(P)/FAD-dependent oxidoreductase [Hyphomicrobiaceae bacterium]
MTPDVETVVVGAGVIGLAIAAELARRGAAPLLLDRNARCGAETSSRNSEVIHAGLYYPHASLKARLCVEGREQLYRFAARAGVAAQRIGKLLVANGDAEIAHLQRIAAMAARNGVADLVWLSAAEARGLEPELVCDAACFSPSTGIVDSHALMLALEGQIAAAGGEIVLLADVTRISHMPGGDFQLVIDRDGEASRITARRVVMSAGLDASRLASTLWPPIAVGASRYTPPATRLAKGHYFTLTGKAPFSRLIYPMPGEGGLGIHLTLDTGGAARFGPDVAWIDGIDYSFDDPTGERRRRFEAAIRRWWPGLPEAALQPGYTGIRPKLSGPDEPTADFAIHGPRDHGIARLVALYGIESPGLTASLAIARYVADLALN